MRTPLLSFLALFIGLSVYGSKAATSVKWRFAAASIQLEQVVSGLDQPLYVTNAGDGSNRLFIVEKPGRIKVLQSGSATPTLFLDITQKVSTDVERGLLCLVFYPQIEPNRRFFVSYTRQSDGALVIAQYRVSNDPNVADPTETAILIIPQLTVEHHAGMLAFGPDGYLYISAGDSDYGFDPNNFAQNINDLRGKMLRIDIDHPSPPMLYSCPPSNPFVGGAGACEIFAYGFRNPWRFSFDGVTGQLYVADVGQNDREEVDLVTLGGNYGWRVFEGTECTNLDPVLCNNPSNFIFPIAEYGHTFGRCAIIGGYAYRGTQSTLPSGAYIYGDLCSGEIFMLSGGTSSVLIHTTLSIDSFGEDEAGEIYVVDINGSVQRIVGSSASTPPVAKCKNVTVAAGPNCSADASIDDGSFDPDPGDTITLSQSPPGPYGVGNTLVTLTVTDNHGESSQCQATVTVTDSGQPVFPNGCPAPLTTVARTSCPFATSAAVSYSTPAAAGNCPNLPVSCNPPSASTFPVGTTTVTCTATTGPNNTATCDFTVTVFSFCLQDETTPGNFALINGSTGDYSFFCNGVLVASGRGTLTARGCLGSIEHIKGDRRVLIQWDTSAQSGRGSGTASIRLGSTTRCSITDKDMSNNACATQ